VTGVSLYGFTVFCAVYVLAVATPGPGVAAVLARSLVRGSRGAPAFIAGFLVGDLVWFTLAATGLAAIAERAQVVFVILKYAGAVYLLYLAWKLWTARPQPVEAREMLPTQSSSDLFLGSLALTLGNPKTMVFFLALLPSVVDLSALGVSGFLEIAMAIVVLLPLVLGCYVLAAARAREFFRSTRAIRALNRSAGTAMAGAAVAVAAQ
jgi:threonine/homoserine/homoserine lactone efflux protein